MTDISNNPRIGQTTTPQYIEHGKSYGTGKPAAKAEGTGDQGGGDLRSWYNDAKTFFDSVQNGTHQLTPEEQQGWQEFCQEYQWANGQLFGQGGGGWDPNAQGAGGPGGNGGPQGGTNEFGGEMGPDGNYMYDTPGGKTQIGFTGDNTRNDIYGDDNQLILDMPSAKVTYEETQDHGQPVLKVIVTTSHGTAAYYYSDYKSPNFKLDIQTLDPSKITGPTITGVSTHTYDPVKASQPPTPQSDIQGSPTTDSAGKPATYYEATAADKPITFTPQASGAGTSETHYVYGNSIIAIPLSSTANVQNAGPYEANAEGGPYDNKITVTHKDGSTDIFYTKKPPWGATINGVGDNISVGGTETVDPTTGKTTITGATSMKGGATNPAGFEGITINDQTAPQGTTHEGDTAPDKTDGNLFGIPVYTYNTQPDVTIHAGGTTASTFHDIYASGTVTISPETLQDPVVIDRDPATGNITVAVTRANGVKEEFIVHQGFTALNITNALGTNVTYGPGFSDQATGLAAMADLNKISVNGANAGQALAAAAAGAAATTGVIEKSTLCYPGGNMDVRTYKAPSVSLSANYDDTSGNGVSEIFADNFTLTTNSLEQVTVNKTNAYYEIVVTRYPGGAGNVRNFYVDPTATSININGTSNVSFGGDPGVVKVNGTAPAVVLNAPLAAFATAIGKSDDIPGLSAAILSHFPILSAYDKDGDGKLSAAELNAANAAGAFPPPNLSNDLINFLKDIDVPFNEALSSVHPGDASGLKTATPRLVTLLNALYGAGSAKQINDTVTIPGFFGQPSQTVPSTDWRYWNDISFNGTNYSYSAESGTLSDVNVATF
jgi:hypothetical protein